MSDGFETTANRAVVSAGLPMGDQDAEVLQLISGAFDIAMKALDEVDLAELPLEPDLDPSRAPR